MTALDKTPIGTSYPQCGPRSGFSVRKLNLRSASGPARFRRRSPTNTARRVVEVSVGPALVLAVLGVPHHPPEPGAEINLSEEKFNTAFSRLQSIGVPMRDDRHSAWVAFRAMRAQYEPPLAGAGSHDRRATERLELLVRGHSAPHPSTAKTTAAAPVTPLLATSRRRAGQPASLDASRGGPVISATRRVDAERLVASTDSPARA